MNQPLIKVHQLAVKSKHVMLSLPALRTLHALIIESTKTNSKIPKLEQDIISQAILKFAASEIGRNFPFDYCPYFQWLYRRKGSITCKKSNDAGGDPVNIDFCIQCTKRVDILT